MIIGADVSHAAPGSSEASFAAITVSMDQICARYAAAVEANGFRAEMITSKNIEKMLTPLIEHWKENIGSGRIPDQVYYFRDGVSEGQYDTVLNTEVEAMKQLFSKLGREKINKVSFFFFFFDSPKAPFFFKNTLKKKVHKTKKIKLNIKLAKVHYCDCGEEASYPIFPRIVGIG